MLNSNQSRGFLPLGVSRKRNREKEAGSGTGTGFDGFKKPSKPVSAAAARHLTEMKPGCSNRLLAGNLANEYITKGTLLGQQFDAARAEAAPVKKKGADEANKPIGKHESYADVANLLKSEGTHIPGIVNPTQLARWLQNSDVVKRTGQGGGHGS